MKPKRVFFSVNGRHVKLEYLVKISIAYSFKILISIALQFLAWFHKCPPRIQTLWIQLYMTLSPVQECYTVWSGV
jgi:hypothetical protein